VRWRNLTEDLRIRARPEQMLEAAARSLPRMQMRHRLTVRPETTPQSHSPTPAAE
jgi:hypothetical protein